MKKGDYVEIVDKGNAFGKAQGFADKNNLKMYEYGFILMNHNIETKGKIITNVNKTNNRIGVRLKNRDVIILKDALKVIKVDSINK